MKSFLFGATTLALVAAANLAPANGASDNTGEPGGAME